MLSDILFKDVIFYFASVKVVTLYSLPPKLTIHSSSL